MDKKKVVKGAVGGILVTAGVAAKIADKCLSIAEVVLNGAENLADSFVKAPKLGIGKSLLNTGHKVIQDFSKKTLKKGKEMF